MSKYASSSLVGVEINAIFLFLYMYHFR